ncbi:hypothetical protein BT63DRAFT_419881 [Microthyrium microscopicum]|uniref:Uncharacterized protein n=1 Tax=Microthyrium microscopicum TaxID=703497 RepID=A0A6A6UT45_9PEZI|nr:hypothetical protein BT63DRAFT_419881 [Microthyrium microscopicum]
MSAPITRPQPRELIPPLLACLPTAAFSPKAPPALLDLLTPILRQRLNVFASSPNSDSWLKLLNWDRDQAAKLPPLVEQLNFEPHPVSGELEIEDIEKIEFRRLDQETIHARLEVAEYDLLPTYLWVVADKNNGGTGWRLSELRVLEDKDDSADWFDSIAEAETRYKEKNGSKLGNGLPQNGTEEEDDSAYWAAYDMTPGRTPAKRSPAPGAHANGFPVQAPSKTEMEYFERYLSEVQPATDPYDPEEDNEVTKESTLNHHRSEFAEPETSAPNGTSTNNGTDPVELVISVPDSPHHPQPMASSPRSVEALDAVATDQSQAEIGIKQHISTDIKSLFRLARSAGISREEFERVVKTELEVLPLMDME